MQQPSQEDIIFLRILDYIGAISTVRRKNKQKSCFLKRHSKENVKDEDPVIASKYRIFWRAVREIADREIAMEYEEYPNDYLHNLPLCQLLECFPDESKQFDGRTWLPLHFAVVLPCTDLADIKTLLASQPQTTMLRMDDVYEYNPCHLAVMAQNPRLEVIQLLQEYSPMFGSSLAYDWNTPLHLAAMHSNSAAMVQELIRFHAPALEMRNVDGYTPLCMIQMNISLESPKMVQSLLEANPETARMVNPESDQLPLNDILRNCDCDGCHPPAEMIAALLAAYPDAVDIPDGHGYLSIHYAANQGNTEILKVIDEANKDNLSVLLPDGKSVADKSLAWQYLDNLRYIQSRVPELLTAPNHHSFNLLKRFIRDEYHFETGALRISEELTDPLSRAADILRFLLPLYSSSDIAAFGEDLLSGLSLDFNGTADDHDYVRRLILRAGAPSLRPDLLKNLNYIARRGALLAFFGRTLAGEPPTILYRIRHGAGSTDLMRTIIEFL